MIGDNIGVEATKLILPEVRKIEDEISALTEQIKRALDLLEKNSIVIGFQPKP